MHLAVSDTSNNKYYFIIDGSLRFGIVLNKCKCGLMCSKCFCITSLHIFLKHKDGFSSSGTSYSLVSLYC